MPHPLPLRDVTVGALLSRLAEALPDREALVYSHTGARWTFRALNDEARLVARGLIANGVMPGDRVAVWATNMPEWIVLQFALAKIGAILVTVNTALRAPRSSTSCGRARPPRSSPSPASAASTISTELRSIGAIGARRRLAGSGCRICRASSSSATTVPTDLIPYDDSPRPPANGVRHAISTRSKQPSAWTT